MISLFFTQSTQHLSPFITPEATPYSRKQFSDGEYYIALENDMSKKQAIVIASTIAPAEHIIELLLLLNALQREHTSIHLLLTYFGYARQDKANKGEALGSHVMLNCLKQFNMHDIGVIHIHNPALSQFLPFTPYTYYDHFALCMHDIDIIVAPDQGAYPLAHDLARTYNKQVLVLDKIRPHQEKVIVLPVETRMEGKKVLIVDDMISTGETIIKAGITLQNKGVHTIYAAATHGLFTGNALEKFEDSIIKKVCVTNTINQKQVSSKLSVVTIAPLIQEYIIRISDNAKKNQ